MHDNSFSGSATITDAGIKKHFRNYEPIQVLFELIWNGLDANAKTINVEIKYTELGGLESITVIR